MKASRLAERERVIAQLVKYFISLMYDLAVFNLEARHISNMVYTA
jgi:hypothetical protein